MVYKSPSTPEEFEEYLEKDKEEEFDLLHEINKDISEKRIESLKEKRLFLQNFTNVSITLLGLISALSFFEKNHVVHLSLLLFGIALHLLLICFVSIYIKEQIDNNIEGLMKEHDRLAKIQGDKIDLIQSKLLNFIKNPTTPQEAYKNYITELMDLSVVKEILEKKEKLTEERKTRMDGNAAMDYSGEIIVFLFTSGIVLIFFSIFEKNHYYLLASICTIIFYLCFGESLNKNMGYLYKMIRFLNKPLAK